MENMSITLTTAIQYGILIGSVIFVIYANKSAVENIKDRQDSIEKRLDDLEDAQNKTDVIISEIKTCLNHINESIKAIKDKLNVI